MFLIITLYAVWSSVFSIGKIALEHSPPLFLTAVRMLIGGALILLYLFCIHRKNIQIPKKNFLYLLLLGFFSVYLTNILEYWGLQHLSAAKTCFIYSLSPFFSALFSYLHFKEKMTPKKWLGMTIGVVGVVPVLVTQTGSEELFSIWGFLTWPSLAVAAAALCAVYGWVLLRMTVKDEVVSPILANGVSMSFGGFVALLHSSILETWIPAPFSEQHMSRFFVSTLVIVLISNLVCYNLYGYLLKRYTATFLSFMGLLSPLFASLNSWILLGEPPSLSILLSTCIVSMGLWLVYQAELKQGYVNESKKTENNTALS